MTDPPIPTVLVDDLGAPGTAREELLATAVASCRDVVGLSEGTFGEVATHLAGRRVPGIRLHEDRIEVHVIAGWGVPLPVLAKQVRTACAPFAEGRPVDVSIDDVMTDEPDDSPPAAELVPAVPAAPEIP